MSDEKFLREITMWLFRTGLIWRLPADLRQKTKRLLAQNEKMKAIDKVLGLED